MVGTGRARAAPDMLRVEMAVQVHRAEVSAALSGSTAAAAALLGALRSHGVAEQDLQTSGLSVQPDNDYSGNVPVVRGYHASEQVSLRLRDLATAGEVLAETVAAAGDAVRVNGAWLEISDASGLLVAARDAAFDDARTKAAQYARAAGRELGAVRWIVEGVAGHGSVRPRMMALAAEASPVPIEAGSTDVEAAVTVVWELL